MLGVCQYLDLIAFGNNTITILFNGMGRWCENFMINVNGLINYERFIWIKYERFIQII